ncbi:molybdopterin converting factor subunit 1 [Thiorhodovibrio frisius]|uniref:Molybdopterin synthase sulfur carrier subunit n=1 Tax=Thiorhodovibrio frisius TaxID=631362 RepID=H8Z765_9GAMM|nr:molybdopterin converting factor subunit 1 [Thiorhodovibrio frisius]EIC20864.1 molybdopterin converting factor, subunit 1 [Thiorhodovibrio frisius]WPL21919.1 Sulfur carrier protein MoaD [Thiorhodovibrio frisius]
MIRLLYFASLREALDCEGEDYPLEAPITTAELRAQLAMRGQPWSDALALSQSVLAAVNQSIASADAIIKPGDEVAFFPPVTGG